MEHRRQFAGLFADARRLLGQAAYRMGDILGAISVYDALLARAPGDADATAAQRARLRESGAMIALRDNEDAAATRSPEAGNSAEVFFTEGRLFPLRCC